jgi:hypothetical protein
VVFVVDKKELHESAFDLRNARGLRSISLILPRKVACSD